MLRRLDGRRIHVGPSALRGGFVAAGLIATAIVAIALVRQDNDDVLRQSLERQTSLSRILSDLQDAESSQRGFLLTGSEQFSRLHEAAATRVGMDFAALEHALAAKPDQLVRATRLKGLAEARLAELAAALSAARAGDREAVHASLQVREGGTRMVETARTYIGEIAAMEAGDIERRRERSRLTGVVAVLTTAGFFALMTILSLAAIREARRREVLARYLPGEIAAVLADGATSLREGSQRHAAVVFVDLRGSTALAERLAPSEFMAVLSAYRRRVSEAARLSFGMVDKFIGDGALVVFGVTGRTEQSSADALRFADRLLAAMATEGGPTTSSHPIRIAIGVHYGPLFCGVLGDDERQEFTVLGDTVNVASRLQEQCKLLHKPLLVSSTVLRAAGAQAKDWDRVGDLSLPGRSELVETFSRATPKGRGLHAEQRAAFTPTSAPIE